MVSERIMIESSFILLGTKNGVIQVGVVVFNIPFWSGGNHIQDRLISIIPPQHTLNGTGIDTWCHRFETDIVQSSSVSIRCRQLVWSNDKNFFLKNRNDNDNKKRLSHVYTPTFSIARWRRKASSKNSFRKTGPNVCVLSIVLYSNCVIEIIKVYYHFLFVFFFQHNFPSMNEWNRLTGSRPSAWRITWAVR